MGRSAPFCAIGSGDDVLDIMIDIMIKNGHLRFVKQHLCFFLPTSPQVTALLDTADQDTDAMAWCAFLAARWKLPPSSDSPLLRG